MCFIILFVQVINMDAFSAFSETSYDSKSIHESSSSSFSTADSLFSVCSHRQMDQHTNTFVSNKQHSKHLKHSKSLLFALLRICFLLFLCLLGSSVLLRLLHDNVLHIHVFCLHLQNCFHCLSSNHRAGLNDSTFRLP